jgi:hypothetical protein
VTEGARRRTSAGIVAKAPGMSCGTSAADSRSVAILCARRTGGFAIEVEDVRADGMLPAKSESLKLATLELNP